MLEDELKNLVERCTSLPSPPGVALRLLDLFRDENASITNLSEVIRNDPALSARVLQIVNSAFYGLRCEVSSLNHAISLLGATAVKSVALSFSLTRLFTRSNFDFRWYWKRSVIAAASAQELGKILRLPEQETLFMGGLLQDLGILVLIQVLKDEYIELLKACSGDHLALIEKENERFGADHAIVGGWLVSRWGLPETIQRLVTGSHGSDSVRATEGLDQAVRCVALSGWLAEIWMADEEDIKLSSQRAVFKSRELLGIDEKTWEPVLSAVGSSLVDLSSLFDFKLEEQKQVDQLLDRARETMFQVSLQSAAEVQARSAEVDSLRWEVGEMKARSETDPLTGLPNRAFFQSAVVRQFDNCQARDTPLTLVVCDIDRFKMFNDIHGHAVGDVVLKQVATAIAESLRETDQAARFGGEEFVLILPNTDEKEAEIICERLRSSLESREISLESDHPATVTISLGSATQSVQTPFENSHELFKAADRALYEAKARGRNRAVSFRALASG